MPKIACNYTPPHIKKFREILEDFSDVDYVKWDYDQILKSIGGYEAFIPSISIPLDRNIFDAAKSLKVIATPSTGTDHIDLQEATNRNIPVLSLKDDIDFLKKITSTAEQALALMLSSLRMLPAAFESVKQGEWDSSSFRGHMASGKTLGIIGFGRLGEMMARYGHALWMKIVVTDPYKKVNVDYVKQISLDELLRIADIISVHVHLNDKTRGMLGRQEFKKMKDGAIIINTSRGAVIEEATMVKALKAGKLGGAGLDVLTDELYKDVGTLSIVRYAQEHKNIVITPHIGGVTYESQEMACARIATKLKKWFQVRT